MNKLDNKKSGTEKPGLPAAQPGSGMVIVTGVAKKNNDEKLKGELIEQNQDGLEVGAVIDRNLVFIFKYSWPERSILNLLFW